MYFVIWSYSHLCSEVVNKKPGTSKDQLLRQLETTLNLNDSVIPALNIKAIREGETAVKQDGVRKNSLVELSKEAQKKLTMRLAADRVLKMQRISQHMKNLGLTPKKGERRMMNLLKCSNSKEPIESRGSTATSSSCQGQV